MMAWEKILGRRRPPNCYGGALTLCLARAHLTTTQERKEMQVQDKDDRGSMIVTGRGISHETWVDIINLLNRDLLLPVVGKPENEIIVDTWMVQSKLKDIPADARIELVFPQKPTSPTGRVPLLEVYANIGGKDNVAAGQSMAGAGKEVR